mgnify:CR=1 FL=1
MSHKALIGLVVVSIALNLLLAGLIGGHMLREGRPSPPPFADVDAQLLGGAAAAGGGRRARGPRADQLAAVRLPRR